MTFIKAVVPVTALAAAFAASSPAASPERLTVPLRSAENQPVGEVVLEQTPHGVLVTADMHGLPPGEHAFHVHDKGECTPPFKTAGDHFNPKGASHGFQNPKGAHAGDLPNLTVPADGKLKVEFLAKGVTLERGKANSLLDRDGSAVIVHAAKDDYMSDPAGNAGDRIACGAIDARAAGTSPRAER